MILLEHGLLNWIYIFKEHHSRSPVQKMVVESTIKIGEMRVDIEDKGYGETEIKGPKNIRLYIDRHSKG